ncbi:cytidylyltransferase domain-containing protein [Leptospira alstonii]|uniref:Cytidylyltransferase n=2 Tax=Leptospira alstonii TaxID=28452 RepID=M6CRP9_9LEPT|nr:cytidylyltransferase [Leptospira alstonii]EMJ94617.1 cytidylyltransferase [Leptospira alstonii serovar Sichuan str. 79601]EQA81246.1 cytidylyltransferase [Leptospira alstonii serovar Pingchang str. 80-412]
MSGIRSTRNIYAFIQARTGSTRFPGKVLKEFPSGSGKTLIDRIQDRILTVLPEEQIVYLIPDGDEELGSFLKRKNYRFFSGDLNDVRRRYISAAEFFKADAILRLTGDNPFYDTLHLDQLLQTFQFTESDLSYVTGLPLGMGGEIFTREALEWSPKVLEERHKEHVSLAIKENPHRFRIVKLSSLLTEKEKEILPKLRLTIDELSDFQTTSKIFNILNDEKRFFGAKECVKLFERDPNVFAGNQNVEQIRFRTLSADDTKEARIGFLIGNPKEFGSGHFERSRILFALLSANDYETIWLEEFSVDGEADLIVVDSRDILIPEYSKTRILLLDHFGPDRKKYEHYDLLPHPENSDRFSLDQILIPPALLNVDRKSDGSHLLCYAGNIDSRFSKELDSFLESLNLREKFSRVVRVGGAPPVSNRIEFVSRVSKFEFQNLLINSSGFVGYFGQSLFEAIFLNKKVCSYSIGPVHSSLSLLCENKYGIPFAGELNSKILSREVDLKFSARPVSGEGYSRLLREIERILD